MRKGIFLFGLLWLTGFTDAQVFLFRNQQNLDTLKAIMSEPNHWDYSGQDSVLWFFDFGMPIQMVRVEKTAGGYQQVFKALYANHQKRDLLTYTRRLTPAIWQHIVGKMDEDFFEIDNYEGARARSGLENWAMDVHLGKLVRKIQYIGDDKGPNRSIYRAGSRLKGLFFDEVRYHWQIMDSAGEPVTKVDLKWGSFKDFVVKGGVFEYAAPIAWNRKSYFYAMITKEGYKTVTIKVDFESLEARDTEGTHLEDTRWITLYKTEEVFD